MIDTKVRDKKRAAVASISEAISSSMGFVALDFRGITVLEISKLRAELRELGTKFTVVKNTVLRFALLESGIDVNLLADALVGPTALAFIDGELGATLKLLLANIRDEFSLRAKVAYIEGQVYQGEQILALSKLPSRDQLLAQLLGTLNAPVQQLAGVMQAVPQSLVRVLSALEEKVAS